MICLSAAWLTCGSDRRAMIAQDRSLREFEIMRAGSVGCHKSSGSCASGSGVSISVWASPSALNPGRRIVVAQIEKHIGQIDDDPHAVCALIFETMGPCPEMGWAQHSIRQWQPQSRRPHSFETAVAARFGPFRRRLPSYKSQEKAHRGTVEWRIWKRPDPEAIISSLYHAVLGRAQPARALRTMSADCGRVSP